MANLEHVKILKQGWEAWNRWRVRTAVLRPDLSGVIMRQADLRGFHLNSCNLCKADLAMADLRRVSLWRADLRETNLCGATLEGAYFDEAVVGMTEFGNTDLSKVKGLEAVRHLLPSTIDIDTLERSRGEIPELFLRSAGISEDLITYAQSLVPNPIEYFTCFISYSSKDYLFVERLYSDLQNRGVRCWLDREDLKIGEKYKQKIDEAIRMYDKLLLVLSPDSIASEWVEREVEAAFEKEQRTKKAVLFPIRLDETVMEVDVAWAGDIRRTRHIGDFTRWLDPLQYKTSFDRLVRDLQGVKD